MTIANDSSGLRRLGLWNALRGSRTLAAALLVACHAAALAIMIRTEADWFGTALFLLTWGFLNGLAIAAIRRPAMAAAFSLAFVALLLVLSMFKSWAIWTTLNFFDFLIVNTDTVNFLLGIYPELVVIVAVGLLVAVPLLVLTWRIDPFRVPRLAGAAVAGGCVTGLVALSLAVPEQPTESFQGVNHVSNFSRSGVLAVSELTSKGWIELDATPDRLGAAGGDEACRTAGKRPHIILVLDEASFDITAAPGIKVPAGYGSHFRSFDGKTRKFVVEGTGGPTWYTEYNVLTGLSARSYGGLKFYVTRIAADRVERGLPQALRRCGYKTVSLYPAYGAFLSARRFQQTTGVERFIDQNDMRAGYVEPDRFYYDQALQALKTDKDQPKFIFVYTVANHFPWHERYLPGDTPEWRDPGNGVEVDEYIRRQAMSARDYRDFVARLKREHPDQPFLIVRFGDHQPSFSRQIVEPSLDDAEVGRRLAEHDPRYFTTYYAIEGVNFTPADVSSALDRLEAPYLPIVIKEAAGLPLDPSFAEQKRILTRCQGAFYLCAGGAEARQFNRLLIDAGLIKGMVSR